MSSRRWELHVDVAASSIYSTETIDVKKEKKRKCSRQKELKAKERYVLLSQTQQQIRERNEYQMVSRIKQASATSGSQSLSSQDSGNRAPRKKTQPDSGFDANQGYKRQPHERTEKSRGTRITAPGTDHGREEHRKSCHQEKDNRNERY